MSFVFRAASFAAVAFCAVATIVATDPSLAVNATVTNRVAAPVLSVEPAALADDGTVFAPRREIVQKIPASSPTPQPADATDTDTAPARSLSELVSDHEMPQTLDRDLRCLAGAVYFEAKSEPLEGQLAVAEVVINRAESGRFPRSICSVVFQPSQFSFVRHGDFPPIRTGSRDWADAVAIAEIALKDQWESRASNALYFHAKRVSPNWGKTRVAQLGNHIFYR